MLPVCSGSSVFFNELWTKGQVSTMKQIIASRKYALLLVVGLLGGFVCNKTYSQQPEKKNVESDDSLLNEEPFDLMFLTSDSTVDQIKVMPIEFPDRKIPSNPDPNTDIIVSPVRKKDRKYRVDWKYIKEIKLYEDMVLEETKRLIQEKKYAAVFEHIDFLSINYPNTPKLDEIRQDFLFSSALDMFRDGSIAHSLAVLEGYSDQYPTSRVAEVRQGISNMANSLIDKYYSDGDLIAAQTMVARLETDYASNPLQVVGQWKQRFEAEARQSLEKARQAESAGEMRLARNLATRSLEIFPDLEDGKDFLKRLIASYPMIRVGVFQRSKEYDPTSLYEWASRRAGQLVTEPLFRFRNSGPEGGIYNFAFGSYEQSDDRRELYLDLDKLQPGEPNAFDLSQWFLRRSIPSSPSYLASWGSLFDYVDVESDDRMTLHFKKPHVLPHALMQWELRDLYGENLPTTVGDFRITESDDGETEFKRLAESAPQPGEPLEIVEIYYDSPKDAVSDLARGSIEVIDQLYPADVRRFSGKRQIAVEEYSLPTVHMLIPMSDDKFLSDPFFRRALLYAVDRESILNSEILGNAINRGSRLVSGPFPKGASENDPLSYAYNGGVEPYPYDNRFALLMLKLSEQMLTNTAIKRNEEPPVMRTLKLGVPDFETAKIAAEACIQQWAIIDVNVEMVVLKDGITDEALKGIDLLYAAVAIWEPVTDAERLLGEDGLAATDNPFIVQALGNLRRARNWKEVRDAMQDLHLLIHQHLPLLPLWQVTDAFAYSTNVSGISRRPMTLYQGLQNWRVSPR